MCDIEKGLEFGKAYLSELYNDHFYDYISGIILASGNEKYGRITEEMGRLSQTTENLNRYLDFKEPAVLSKEETEALTEYMRLADRLSEVEMEAAYLQGHRDCLAYMKLICREQVK